MEELGIVTELKANGIALVKTQGGESCGSCGCRGGCQALEGNVMRQVPAVNQAGATLGDQVLISIGSGSFLKASFLIYLVPVLALMIGSIVGQTYSAQIWAGANPETVAVLTGIFSFGASFVVIRLLNNYFGQNLRYYPVIKSVIPPDSSP